MRGTSFTYVLFTLSCLPAVSVSRRTDFHTLIRPYTYTSRGEWGFVDWCPFGTYAYAFNLKFEKPHGMFGDDTALNGIRLDCRYVITVCLIIYRDFYFVSVSIRPFLCFRENWGKQLRSKWELDWHCGLSDRGMRILAIHIATVTSRGLHRQKKMNAMRAYALPN